MGRKPLAGKEIRENYEDIVSIGFKVLKSLAYCAYPVIELVSSLQYERVR